MRVKDSTKNLDCFKATWRYFGDKGVYLVLINLLPSLMIPFAMSPSVSMYYLFDMKTLNITSIASLFEYMWSVSSAGAICGTAFTRPPPRFAWPFSKRWVS